MRRKRLRIDDDLMQAARDYVNAQLDIMAKYGARPTNVDEDMIERLANEVAQYPQALREQD